MSEPTGCGYQALPESVQAHPPASVKKFFVFLAGNTNGAHRDLVQKLKRSGQTEATSAQRCDYVLVFCPVASRVGTDIHNALSKAPALKPLVLVVMHHTFDHECVVAHSRRQVSDPRVRLTVDCLFYENHFLDCQRNDDAWRQISNYIRPVSCAPVRTPFNSVNQSRLPRPSIPDCSPFQLWVLCGALVFLLVILIILLVKVCNGSI